MDAKRRKLKEDLEARELNAASQRDEETLAARRLQREVSVLSTVLLLQVKSNTDLLLVKHRNFP